MNIVDTINYILSNDTLRTTLVILCSIFIGYTLRPIPNILDQLFNTSILFKFAIILLLGFSTLYPLNRSKMINVIIGAVIIMLFFHLLR
jgi:hypothetical protein